VPQSATSSPQNVTWIGPAVCATTASVISDVLTEKQDFVIVNAVTCDFATVNVALSEGREDGRETVNNTIAGCACDAALDCKTEM